MYPRALIPIFACLALAAHPPGTAAQTTAYVPMPDQAYDDLDVLVSAGLVRNIVVAERPHSRTAFRRFVEEAAVALDEGTHSRRIREAWARLEHRFSRSGEGSRGLRPTPTRVDLVVSDSPFRPLRSGADDEIDGVVNPLLQRNGGRKLVDGLTLAVESGVSFEGAVAGAVSPRAFLAAPRGSGAVEVEAQVVEAYARTLLGPVALEVGRLGVTWGHGTEGGAVLSGNARGVDMVRLAADRPVRLPGFLAGLGLWKGSLALGTMGRDRDVPGSKAIMARVGARPSQYVELGFNYLNIQGGEGAPEATVTERIKDFFLFLRNEIFEISDKVAGLDVRIFIPRLRSTLYANFLTTDDRGQFQQPARGYWEDAVWVVGAGARDLGPDGRLAVSAEWRHAGARAHAHGQFTSGVTLDGRVMGDPLGPNAASVSAALEWTGPASRVGVRGAWERYSGDRFDWDQLLDDDGDVTSTAWYLVADNPDEVRRRLVVDYVRFAGSKRMEASVRLGYEHVTRFDYGDAGRHNLLAHATLRYIW